MKSAAVESAIACLNNARKVLAVEFELDEQTNLFRKPLPSWVAELRDLIHAASDHLANSEAAQ